jgi:predicted nucleic acid-binding protein
VTLRFLVDTDWAIEYLKGRAEIVERLDTTKSAGLGISIISLAELYEGVHYSRDPKQSEEGLNKFLSGVEILGLDAETCRIFGQQRGRLRKEGRLVGDFDTLIAATCLRHNLTLFTNNRRHFEVFEQLTIESL